MLSQGIGKGRNLPSSQLPLPTPMAVLEAVLWSSNLPWAIAITIVIVMHLHQHQHSHHDHHSCCSFGRMSSLLSSSWRSHLRHPPLLFTPCPQVLKEVACKFHLEDHGVSFQLGEMVEREPLTSQRMATVDDGAELGVAVVIAGSTHPLFPRPGPPPHFAV